VVFLLLQVVSVVSIVYHVLSAGLFDLPELPVLPPQAAGGKEDMRGHLALRREGSPPSCTTCFSVMMGLALFMTFIEYYFANVAHASNFVQTTAAVAVLALVGAAFSAFILGMLSDHIRRTPVVCVATILMSLAAFTFVVFPGNVPLWPLGVLFSLGYGAYTSVDWALAIDAMPSLNTIGKDMGLWSASTTLPAIIAPVLGSLTISLASNIFGQTSLGYRLVFAIATIFLLLGAVFILRFREQRAHLARAETPIPTPPATSVGAQFIALASSPAHSQTRAHSHRRSPGLLWKLAFQTRAGRTRGFLVLWPLWERFTVALWHVRPIPAAPNHLLEARFTRYHGRPIDLPDGTHVQNDDRILELHFSNRHLLAAATEAGPWDLVRMIGEDMAALARWTQQLDFPAQIQAVYGVTLLYRGASRLGFTLRERLVTLLARRDRIFMTGLLFLYHQQGLQRLLQGTTYGTYPQEVWISRKELIRKDGGY
jgi:MFS family permease